MPLGRCRCHWADVDATSVDIDASLWADVNASLWADVVASLWADADGFVPMTS